MQVTTGGAAEVATVASATASPAAPSPTSNVQLASVDLTQTTIEFAADDAYADWSAASVTKIQLNGTSASINGAGAEAKAGLITITAAGTYVLSGTLDDGQIVVHGEDKGTVRLILNGVTILNSSSAAIFVEEAGKTIISLEAGTENLVSDATAYVYPDAETDEPDSAIFSVSDGIINVMASGGGDFGGPPPEYGGDRPQRTQS